MKISYDPEVDALDIVFQDDGYSESREISEDIIVDYSADGKVLSIEILNASTKLSLESIGEVSVSIPVSA